MIKVKFCGLSRICDIEGANALMPEYIGFVFAPQSRRCILPEKAAKLKSLLSPGIKAVGVFVNQQPEFAAELLNSDIIDIVQLHGNEEDDYIEQLRRLTNKPIIQAFRITGAKEVIKAKNSIADCILLDAGAGTGTSFDWKLVQNIKRPYFLAGGLNAQNARAALSILKPYALDVSSGIETNGLKDTRKMAEFIRAVRKEAL